MLIEDLIEQLQKIAKVKPGIKCHISIDDVATTDLKKVDIYYPWDGKSLISDPEYFLELEG